MIFGDLRITLFREREAEVRDPETGELVETFMVPDDLRLDNYVTKFVFHIEHCDRPEGV